MGVHPGAYPEDATFCDDGDMPVIAGALRTEQIDVIAVDLEGHPDWSTWRVVPGKAIDTFACAADPWS